MNYKKVLFLILPIILGFLIISAAPERKFLLTDEQKLGDALYFDEDLSINRNQSCASCHTPETGFADPDASLPVSNGSDPNLFGGRNAPSAAYAAFSPFFYWNSEEGLFMGGQFWDGRANTLAEQAAGPPLNPVEMAMPDKWSVVSRLQEKRLYIKAFKKIYDLNLSKIPQYNPHSTCIPAGVEEVYDSMAIAIGEFEKSRIVNSFSSKFDYASTGMASLGEEELRGLELFNNKGKCNLCHLSEPQNAPDGSAIPALFTDFTYDNLGLPANLNIPGAPHPVDMGLGGRADIMAVDPAGEQNGKFKVMTLRNVEKTAPYGHNGVFDTLEDIVHFYNTRDVLGVVPDNLDPGFGITGWPSPEVPQNVNSEELGDLLLTFDEEAAIVAFLKTPTDGYGPANGLPPIDVVFPPLP